MSEPLKKKGGRPRKYKTEAERKEAINASNRAARERKQRERQAGTGSLQVYVDPHSILQQASPEGGAHITAICCGIQADGLNIPADEDRLEILEVILSILFIYIFSPFFLVSIFIYIYITCLI